MIVDPISLNARPDFRWRAQLLDLVSAISGRDVMKRRIGGMTKAWDEVLMRDHKKIRQRTVKLASNEKLQLPTAFFVVCRKVG